MVDLIPGFAWRLPVAFAEAVNFCQFARGDIIYDNPVVYEPSRAWRDAVPHLKISLQVKAAMATRVVQKDENQVFATNWKSPLTLELTAYPSLKTHRVESTQGKLYTALWQGDISCLTKDHRIAPKRWKELGQTLRKAKKANTPEYRRFAEGISDDSAPVTFALVGDFLSLLTNDKILRIRKELSKSFTHFERTLHLEEITKTYSLEYVPTTRIACFSVQSADKEKFLKILRNALYNPLTDDPARQKFDLTRHGLLIERPRQQAELSLP
jgi:hypothetical protein